MRFFGAPSGTTLVARNVNGEPGVVAVREGQVAAVLALSMRSGLITKVYVVADPRKLEGARRALAQP